MALKAACRTAVLSDGGSLSVKEAPTPAIASCTVALGALGKSFWMLSDARLTKILVAIWQGHNWVVMTA